MRRLIIDTPKPVEEISTSITDIQIYKSNDYNMFKTYNSNRVVTINRLLEDTILNSNQLEFNPIIVTPDYYVIDGQHRLKVAETHNLMIYFIIKDSGSDLDAQILNISRKNWNQKDHLHFFSAKGYRDYAFIEKMIVEFKISVSTFIAAFCCKKISNTLVCVSPRDFRRGLAILRYNTIEIHSYLTHFAEVCSLFKMYANVSCPHLQVQRSLIKLITHPEYCHERFIKTLHQSPEKILKANSFFIGSYIDATLMNEIYNKNYQGQNRLEV